MSNEFDALVEAVKKKREELIAQVAQLDAQRAEVQAEVKRYDRMINAADPSTKPGRKPAPQGPKRADWRVSSGMIEQVYEQMLATASNNGASEFTAQSLVELTGISEPTIHKTINVLHEQGRIRLIRKDKQKRIWGVVA